MPLKKDVKCVPLISSCPLCFNKIPVISVYYIYKHIKLYYYTIIITLGILSVVLTHIIFTMCSLSHSQTLSSEYVHQIIKIAVER